MRRRSLTADPETLRDGRGPMPRNRRVAGRRTRRRGDERHDSDGGSVSASVVPDLMRGCRQWRKSPRTGLGLYL